MNAREETTLPVTRVTLYTSGVGYFERGGEVGGEARVSLLFPVGQVNDVLKSLVVLEGDGLQPVTYAAQDPVGKALQAFSVDVSDNPTQATLLNRMRGTNVTVEREGALSPLSGVIVGVETQTEYADDVSFERHTLTLLADGGLHSVPLAAVTRLQINDAALAGELRQALATVAAGRDAEKRSVTLAFSGPEYYRVRIGYLVEAPAWQTTYRLILGDAPRLQGWALVQNTGQDDWTRARLSLVSGRPISFIQDLYTPLYVPRPTVASRIPGSPVPQTYASDLQAVAAPKLENLDWMEAMPASASPGPAMARKMTAAAAMPEQAGRQSVATTGAAVGTALFAYEIEVPVSVPRQQSAMIPFVAEDVTAERVSVYNASVQADHPLSGARLKNTTQLHLMGGPLTVFDETAYVGDALMDDTQPGQSRLLTYAVDLAVDADAQMSAGMGAALAVTLAQGTVRVRATQHRETRYTLKNHGEATRTVLIEHPNPGDEWTLREPSAPAERTADTLRFEVAVAPGAAVELVVRLERAQWESVALLQTSAVQLLSYARLGVASKAVQAALSEVAARRSRVADLEAQLAELNRQTDAIEHGQERIRQNMAALDAKSDLYRRYVGQLDADETRLADLSGQRDARQAELATAQTELAAFVAGLELG